jgi:hypothetical protein
MLRIEAQLHPDEAELVLLALRKARHTLRDEARSQGADGAPDTPSDTSPDARTFPPTPATRSIFMPPLAPWYARRASSTSDRLTCGVWASRYASSPMTASELYLFLHVPKTAGTSFRKGLEKAFPGLVAYDYAPSSPETHPYVRQHVYDARDPLALKAKLETEGYRVLGGHVLYRNYAEIFSPDRVVTFLREPIARVVSEHEHACRHQGFQGTLLEFAERPRNRSLQTGMLEGVELDEVGFVGITERYAESLRLLDRRLGWRVPNLVENVNPKQRGLAGSYSVPPEELAQLRIWNKADLALYARAIERFEAALR